MIILVTEFEAPKFTYHQGLAVPFFVAIDGSSAHVWVQLHPPKSWLVLPSTAAVARPAGSGQQLPMQLALDDWNAGLFSAKSGGRGDSRREWTTNNNQIKGVIQCHDYG